MTNERKKIWAWDTCEILDDQVRYLMEEAEPEELEHLDKEDRKDEDKIRQSVDEDEFFWQDQWSYLMDDLAEILSDKSKSMMWRIDATNIDWMGRSGHQYIDASDDNGGSDAEEFIRKLTPDGSEFTLHIYDEDKGLSITCYHHDCPTGTVMKAMPMTVAEYNKNT